MNQELLVGDGQPQVIEIKAGGSLAQAFNYQVATFLQWHDMPFSVVSNEAILAYEQEALNWLPIIQYLACAQVIGIDTQVQEYHLLEKSLRSERPQVSDLLNAGLRSEQWLDEIALHRLIYTHKFKVDLHHATLNWHSEIRV